MRTGKFAGALALAIVSVSLVSAEVIRKAVGQQITPELQASSTIDPGRRAAGRDGAALRVAAIAERSGAVEALEKQKKSPSTVAPDEGPSREGPLVALVIGNAAYPDADSPLDQSVNDARALAAELRGRGFDVELGENLNKQAMERAVERFAGKIRPGATALLFYSGHGVQTGRESFLIPVSAQIWRPEDVRRDGVALEPLVADMNARGAKRKLVILDASRPNPFERRLRGSSAGLAPIAAPQGTLVLYGVAPGKVINDAQGANGLLVSELLDELRTSPGSAEALFNRTRMRVARASNGEQVPGVFSALTEDFAFAPVASAPPSDAPPAKPPRGRQSRR
jgi:uncharacterized caspase-like protein